MEIFFVDKTVAMTLARNSAIELRILASEFSIKRVIMAEFLMMILSKPEGHRWIICSSIANKSLKQGDLSQKPKVNFWHMGKSSSCWAWDFKSRLAKNLVKDSEDRHLSMKWIILSSLISSSNFFEINGAIGYFKSTEFDYFFSYMPLYVYSSPLSSLICLLISFYFSSSIFFVSVSESSCMELYSWD